MHVVFEVGHCRIFSNAEFTINGRLDHDVLLFILQPIVVAMFANSPFKDGRIGDYLSHRGAVWHDTDPDRCGSLPFVFQDGMGFERYTDYVLDVPMYFVIRDGRYIDASGLSFRDFLDGRLSVGNVHCSSIGLTTCLRFFLKCD